MNKITSSEYFHKMKNAKEIYEIEKNKLSIDLYGQCPHYKGHFSFASFVIGFVSGAWASMLITGFIITTLYTCK